MVAATKLLHRELDGMDRIASRFRPDSELSRLNASAGGRAVAVSPELLEALDIALRAAALSEGAVDPTVGGALCRIGYDRDFAAVSGGVQGSLPSPRPIPGWQSVEIDRERSTVRLDTGTRLDLGATAKALAADRIAAMVYERTGSGALVALGGDVALAGPATTRFDVGLADVCGSVDARSAVTIGPGGLATSGIGSRHWTLGRDRVHHIIDPATGLPATGVWKTVSVIAATCVAANTASTAAMVMGDRALEWLDGLGLPGCLVRSDGTASTTGGWPTSDEAESR